MKNSDKYIISWLTIKSPHERKNMTDWNNTEINYHGQSVCTEEAFLVWGNLGNDPAQFSELVAIAIYDQYFDYK